MYFISHRGNLNGPNKKFENSIEYINIALRKGYHVEVDVWYYKNAFYLGHDKPQHKTNKKYLLNKSFWCHAKNFEALINLKKINAHYFWHQKDDFVLTSKGFIWTFPGKKLSKKSIYVLPENIKKFDSSLNFQGICSDYIEKYKYKINKKNEKK